MIITCEACTTRFRLDGSLLKTDGSKVRCSQCRHIFTAFPPLPDADSDLEIETVSDSDIQYEAPQETLLESADKEKDEFESDTLDDAFESDELEFDDTDFDRDLTQDSPPPAEDLTIEDSPQETDIEISFEDEDTDFDLETEISLENEEEEPEDEDFDQADLDDTDPGMSGSDDLTQVAVPLQRPARATLTPPLDFEGDTAFPIDDPRKKHRVLITPVLVLLLIFLLAAGGYIVTTSLGYKIPFLPEIQIPFVQQYLPRKAPDPLPALSPISDQKSVTGRFITNDTAGELFIITGKIENPAQIPYSHIQVKGTLFQKEKIAAMTRTAYCGNVVPEEVLKTGKIPDILDQLKTPEGTAGTNVNVTPGETVPFMLVFPDLPKNLENFTVEVMGFEKTAP